MLKFVTQTENTAKSVNEAVEAASAELGLTEDEVDIEVVDEGTKGFLGIGSKDAKVIATVKDVISYKAKIFLAQVFEGMRLDVTISTKLDGDNLLVDLSGENMGIIIGKRGDTLDSLQYLTSLVVNHDSDEYYKVTIDTENYREKRLGALCALAKRLADKVTKTGKKYTLEPMNPYERRIIHSNLQENEEVTTYSVGEDPYRKVVIAPKNAPARNTYNNNRTSYSGYSGAKRSYNIPHAHNPNKHASFESYAKSFEEDNASETTEE